MREKVNLFRKSIGFFKLAYDRIQQGLSANVYWGRGLASVPDHSIVFFPCRATVLSCGLTGIVSFKARKKTKDPIEIKSLLDKIRSIETHPFIVCEENRDPLDESYLGGKQVIDGLRQSVRAIKSEEPFCEIFRNRNLQNELAGLSERLSTIIDKESEYLSEHMGHLEAHKVDTMSQRIEDLRDIAWCLTAGILDNVKRTHQLLEHADEPVAPSSVKIFKKINSVLNSIDRLEVRGRDSAGISLLFVLAKTEFQKFEEALHASEKKELIAQFNERSNQDVLANLGISSHITQDNHGQERVSISLVYKVAAEIGSLGDNIRFLREQIRNDPILRILIRLSHEYHTVSAHTRWASVGSISEPNCHPVDNRTTGTIPGKSGIIHACLNGDIDNYLDLKREYEQSGEFIPKDITTDTKIIPLRIGTYVEKGIKVEEAFRLAVNDFEGSHAICMHTDLAPGKLFLAQKGSGQAIFVGLAEDHYIPSSEVYGFVEETPFYLKMDGEKVIDGIHGPTQGQILVLNQECRSKLDGITTMYYDGTPIELGDDDIKHTAISSRDIDRQGFDHYFLKEISESPVSVEKTLQNRWKVKEGVNKHLIISLDETVVPPTLGKALADNKIRRIYFVGQGTAGVAALACSDIMNYYMDEPGLQISALKASELSGFKLDANDDAHSMEDALVVAISQSGTTTDTNRTVEMVKERGAHTLAIVNRRDSDITFKVNGVLYTSSGRDIEMSVASTKAFYSQIVAGAILGLYFAQLKGRRTADFISDEIKQLLDLPSHMRTILALRDSIERSAKQLAVTKSYWAAVGSGPNKASSDEIRIKLSELCYKTISSDFIEDKKHIDLSSEPLIIVCAAGTRGAALGDIIKDTAIFQAHKATPVVIADEGEDRFDPYAADVFHVPIVGEHFAPLVNTLAGHLWGYYAALAINDGSRFLFRIREDIQKTIADYSEQGLDIFELVLEKTFREKIVHFYREFRRKKAEHRFTTNMDVETASDLTLLFKYLMGRLPVSDFELDFGVKGTPLKMINTLFNCLGEAINFMARPIDAIKHQAKTVTVGTSRISEKLEGLLFDTLAANHFQISHLTNQNILVLKNLQNIISKIQGAILYRIDHLNLLGEPTVDTTIEVVKKEGVLEPIPSRVETDRRLKGTKRIIVEQGNVYIGKGRKDDRSILIIPIISASRNGVNMIEHLLLLNIAFKTDVGLATKTKALGGKYEHIKNIVQENSVPWDDKYLELAEMEDLFGRSAEKIGEYIVSRQK